MGHIKQQTITVLVPEGERKFKYSINVNQEGHFTAYIPKELINLWEDAGIILGYGRSGRSGFYRDFTMDGLIQRIATDIANYESLELVEQKIILNYVIQTRCSYCLDINNKIIPNGKSEWNQKNGKYNWKQGTVNQSATESSPFGFLIYAAPFVKEIYKRKDKFQVVKYENICYSDWGKEIAKKGRYLHWLESLVAMAIPDGEEVSEIDYDEETARFFVEMIIGICELNERIKDFLNPESIRLMIKNKTKLIGL